MTNMYSNENDVINRMIHVEPVENSSNLQVEETVKIIKENGWKKIALQFPDELLHLSVQVANGLEKLLGFKPFILADTTYASCCIDEVAAQHLDADVVIHYGHSCLSPPSRLPALLVFQQSSLDVPHVVSSFRSQIKEYNLKWVLVSDTRWQHYMTELSMAIPETISTEMPTLLFPNYTNDSIQFSKRSIKSSLPDDYGLLYIGTEGTTLSNLLMTHSNISVISYNPLTKETRLETPLINKHLMKRYVMVQKAKDAGIVGILVGTLGVASYLSVIERIKDLLRAKGRKFYTFVVGKLNPAKLANFMEVEAYVYVACPETTLVDSKEFLQPIVTPYELELALTDEAWTGKYVTDLAEINDRLSKVEIQPMEDASSDEEPHFSLVTGGLVNAQRLPKEKTTTLPDGAMVKRNQNTDIIVAQSSPAGDFLNARTYRGLDSSIEAPVEKAQLGTTGIAKGYTSIENQDQVR